MFHTKAAGILALASTGAAHFFLNSPDTIGFDDSKMDEGPCGGFAPTLRDGPVTEWPANGHPVSLITTHQDVVWHVEAALLSDPTNFVPVVVPFRQTGVGEVCFETVPGKASWVGEDVVISIYQVTNHGNLYQCVAARFTDGPAASVPGTCTSFDGVAHDPIIAAPDDDDDTTTTTTSTPSSAPAPTSDDDHSHGHGHGTTAPSPTSEDDHHSHDHGSPTPTSHADHSHGYSSPPSASSTGGHDHGDGGHGGHDHGDDASSVSVPSASNGTSPVPEPSHVEAGAGKLAMFGAAYVAVGAAVLAVY